MIIAVRQNRRRQTMTVKTLLTLTMIVTAVFVFKDVPAKTLIDIMLAEILVSLFWVPRRKTNDFDAYIRRRNESMHRIDTNIR